MPVCYHASSAETTRVTVPRATAIHFTFSQTTYLPAYTAGLANQWQPRRKYEYLRHSVTWKIYFFYFLLTVHLSIILVTDELKEKNSCFIISLLYSSTCFEHYVLIIRRSKLWPSGAPDGHLQGVMMPNAALCNFDLLMMSTIVLETCRGI